MARKKRIRVEDLQLPRLLQFLGEHLQPDEAVTRIAMSPLLATLADPRTGAAVMFTIMARTATLFVVDYEEFVDVTSSAGPPPVEVGLPPLPYPRIAVECDENYVWKLGSPDESNMVDLEILLIVEGGNDWQVIYLLRDIATDEQIEAGETSGRLMMFTLHGDGSATYFRPETVPTIRDVKDLMAKVESKEEPPPMLAEHHPAGSDDANKLRMIPVNFAHYVNAHGVTVEPVDISRPQRRRFQRKRLVHPQVYFVYVDEETVKSHPGRSDREYHCRWMVRGHWRHFENGSRAWVRPYIKGPPGAPWRGRPIYVINPAA